MVKPAGDRRDALEPGCDMARTFLEDLATLILRQLPPRLRLCDRDQRRSGGLDATERLLPRNQGVVLDP